MRKLKAHKIEIIKNWINVLSKDLYGQSLMQDYNGDELKAMSLKEIEMLFNYIKAVYHHAYNQALKSHGKHAIDSMLNEDI